MQTDYSRAILKYLMDYSNMDYPVNIHQIYEHLFYGQELSDNKKRGKLDTIRKNIVELHASGLIEMDTEFTENTGKKERYKKEDDDVGIWYEQKLDTEYALILIQKIMEMNNLSLDDKKKLVQAICDCAGSKIMESASYAQNVIKSNPLYDLTEKNGVKESILFEGQRRYKAGNREIPDIWILLSNIYNVLEKKQRKKISFKLYKYNSKGQFEVIHDDREYVVSPYFVTERAGMYWLIGLQDSESEDAVNGHKKNLGFYPIDMMKKINVLEEDAREISEAFDGKEMTKEKKYKYIVEHQQVFYDEAEKIVIRVHKKKEDGSENNTAYNLIYRTFGDDFYMLNEGETYDRILVIKSPYFIVKWAIENIRDIEVETETIRDRIRNEIESLDKIYSV